MKLPEFFAQLDKHDDCIPIERLVELMTALDLTCTDIRETIGFKNECYCRNVLKVGTGYAALILCWRDGQGSPAHDHRGSACGVRVLEGTLSETVYRRAPDGRLEESTTNVYHEGHVCGSYDSDTHTIRNCQGNGKNLITLHVYTPPMRNYRVYDLETGASQLCDDVETLAAQRKLGLVPA